VPKDARASIATATVDELNALESAWRARRRGAGAQAPELAELSASLLRIQHELFISAPCWPRCRTSWGAAAAHCRSEVAALEAEIDRATAQLEPLRSFVLPGGSRLNAELHVCRTVCRRAERTAVTLAREGGADELSVRYLNRLSDALFRLQPAANQLLGAPETLWEPNRAASAQ